MKARKLKANQRGPWCCFCPPKSVRATHRDYGFMTFACPDHVSMLPPEPSEYMTDGEYQAISGRWR